MLDQFRLVWRMQRWELGFLVASGLSLTAIALVLPSTGEAGIGDQRMIVLFLTLAGPVLMGSVLGIGVVAGEVEHGTARISWTLAPGRLRWLSLRLWPIALIGTVVGATLGAATARLMDLTSPSDIFMHQMRGPIVSLHLIVALAIGVLVGAVIRRVLPGLLIAMALTIVLFVSTAIALQPWLADQAELIVFAERSTDPIIALIEHDFATVSSDGTLVVSQPECSTQAACMEAMAQLTPVMRVVPGAVYPQLLAIEAGLAAGVVALCMAGTIAVTRRWGPG